MSCQGRGCSTGPKAQKESGCPTAVDRRARTATTTPQTRTGKPRWSSLARTTKTRTAPSALKSTLPRRPRQQRISPPPMRRRRRYSPQSTACLTSRFRVSTATIAADSSKSAATASPITSSTNCRRTKFTTGAGLPSSWATLDRGRSSCSTMPTPSGSSTEPSAAASGGPGAKAKRPSRFAASSSAAERTPTTSSRPRNITRRLRPSRRSPAIQCSCPARSSSPCRATTNWDKSGTTPRRT